MEPLSQFLGRFHHLHGHGCVLDMVDYCQETINLYLDIAGKDLVLRKVSTRYVSDGALTDADYQVTGQVADKASSLYKVVPTRSGTFHVSGHKMESQL